jgi:hypothetical protein
LDPSVLRDNGRCGVHGRPLPCQGSRSRATAS